MRATLLAAVALLAACQPAMESQAPAVTAAARKHAHAQRYAIDSQRSTITLRVFRDGPLARFGHNHVIVATQLEGMVYREAALAESEVTLRFPVAAMRVDTPEDRARAGADFPGALPAAAVAGTREHMLGPQLLAAEQFPHIELRSIAVSGQWPDLKLVVEASVRGIKSQFALPVHIDAGDKELLAVGAARLSLAQLGLRPYSVLGGGLRVGDSIDAQFHIVAVRE